MQSGSNSRRKQNKKLSLTHQNQNRSSPMASLSPSASLAKSPPSLSARRRSYLRRGNYLPSALVALCFLLVLYATRRKFTATQFPTEHQFYSIDIVNEFPHDPDAFTQGLLYGGNDTLFESTGLYRRSSLREVHLQTGKVRVIHQMDESLFGEGLTLLGERLFQVMWLSKTGFLYDRYNFSKREKFTHEMHDGWGLATDGNILFGSDGTSTLYYIDPTTFQVLKRVTVSYHNNKISYLNELEYINGEVWANIWQTDCIARISHEEGSVISWILLHNLRESLLRSGHRHIDVLNGIAWDKEKNRLFVTGKLWPKLYEIKLKPITNGLNERIEKLCPIKS